MNCGIKMENFHKSLDVMEAKVSALENEVSKTTISLSSLSELADNLKNHGLLNEKSDVLSKQIQLLKDENKNLSDDLHEWKTAYNEKIAECEKNREKYLNAQQMAEEYRRQLDALKKDNSKKYEEQANANLVIVNERFKEQLGELGRLPFILEAKQLELQDCYSKLKVAEKTISVLSNDLESCIIKCELQQKAMEYEKSKTSQLRNEIDDCQREISEWKKKFDEIDRENQLLIKSIEKMKFMEDCLQSKTKEVYDLLSQIELLKEEHSRHVLRIKERADIQRRSFQTQITGLEQELVQLRATVSTIHQEREEIKLRMQNDVLKMEQKFNDAQLEIQNLKSHVEILKSSYANILENLDDDDDEDDDDDNEENIDDIIDYHNNNFDEKNYGISDGDDDNSFIELIDMENKNQNNNVGNKNIDYNDINNENRKLSTIVNYNKSDDEDVNSVDLTLRADHAEDKFFGI